MLEQLPEVLVAIGAGAEFVLDFYEQGVQRRVSFTPEGDGYVAKCMSYGHWQPSPAVERLARGELQRELTVVLDEFMRFMRGNMPELARHPWVEAWLEGKAGLAWRE